jgi:C-terminal processing protease CtpA/Prc
VLSYLVNKNLAEYDSSIKRYDKLPYAEYVAAEDTSRLKNEDTARKNYDQLRPGIFSEKKDVIAVWEPAQHIFKGRLFVIINDHVASAASNFTAILKENTNALIIGDETGGNNAAHNAAVFTYELPNSHLKINIPTKRFYQPVLQQTNGKGVTPHKYMPVTVEDVINNSDRPLNYILDSLLTK